MNRPPSPSPRRLRPPPDEAILRLARALARQAAREDHEEAMKAAKDKNDETRRDLRPLLD